MALKTQGFALSSAPRAPVIPANVGAVDVREIYDGVRQGLAAFETARRAPASMALADAEMKAKTLEAPMGTALAQESVIQAPLKTAALAEQVSPERIAIEREALKTKGTRAASGDVQLANALAAAQMRVAEDPADEAAKRLVAALAPMAIKKGAASLANPQGTIDQRAEAVATTDATKRDLATASQQTAKDIALARIEADKSLSSEDRALKMRLAEMGFQNRSDVTAAQNKARIEAAKASMLGRSANKAYDEALKQNSKVQEELVALDTLQETAEAYIKSSMGAGGIAGSAPAVFIRTAMGDNTAKNFEAAIATSMKSAVETMRGLGAMSEKEFAAAMNQLPKLNEPDSAIRQKLGFIKRIRQWMGARNNMYLDELAGGATQMEAGEAVRNALPMPALEGASPPDGNTSTSEGAAPVVAPLTTTPTLSEAEEKELRDLEAKLKQPAQP